MSLVLTNCPIEGHETISEVVQYLTIAVLTTHVIPRALVCVMASYKVVTVKNLGYAGGVCVWVCGECGVDCCPVLEHMYSGL